MNSENLANSPVPGAATKPLLVLMGFMGSGKSTVAYELSRILSVGVVDTDQEIERQTGRKIPEIFADGEDAFRAIEAEIVCSVLHNHSGVVALGGGAIVSAAVREQLKDCRVVYLDISADAGFARVAHSDRPLLKTENPKATYTALLESRRELYLEVATVAVESQVTPNRLAYKIIEALELPTKESR